MASEKARDAQSRLTVTTSLLDARSGEEAPQTFVYLFSRNGDYLTRQPVDKSGRTSVPVSVAEQRQGVRVLVGPATGAEEDAYGELTRRGAVEQSITLDRAKDAELSFQLNRPDWERWLIGQCCVKGHVLKRVGSGANAIDLNVCESTVEIYEVDPWYIILQRIPDSILDRIRQIVLEPIQWPPVGPGPVEGPTDPIPWFQEMIGRKNQTMVAQKKLTFPTELVQLAKTTSNMEFRGQLEAYRADLIHLFCFYWPFWVRTHKVCQTVTNCEGKFTCCFHHSWWNPDIPDLWFRVRQTISGVDTVIYERYPVSCHTWWDYQCGTEVKLYVTNAAARTCCNEPPVIASGNWVILEAIGATSPRTIRGSSNDASTGVAMDGHDKGLTRSNAPFGGLVRPRLRFKDTLRPMGITHYRVSWAAAGTNPLNDNLWHYMDSPVARHYIHDVGGHPVYSAYSLGPTTVGLTPYCLEIPPSAPPSGDWAFPPAYEKDDLTSAYFETTVPIPAASAGKYDIRVQLYNSAGNLVDIGLAGITYYVPALDDLSGTIYTDPAGPIGMVHGNCLVMTLHIDNNVCTAIIGPPEISGVGADPYCGGLNYSSTSSNVSMPFQASHPNGFATYSFSVYRGHANLRDSDSGPVGGGSHVVTDTVSHLLESCTIGAFAEYLHVAATATDGWSTLTQYDRADFFAFTLLPAATS
jgi:hypothetical protein